MKLSMDSFRSIFLHMSHLSISGSLGMIFENFQNSFDPKDSSSFIQFHQLNSNVVVNHIP